MTAAAEPLRGAVGRMRLFAFARRDSAHRAPRVPFIQQLGADDCGASCLAMVLAAHGVHDVAAECRAQCGGGRDGTTLRTLVTIAGQFGLQARAASIPAHGLGGIALPAIAYWESRHFVVVERWTAQRITVVDPAIGRRVLGAAEFAERYSGVILTVDRSALVVRQPVDRIPLWLWYLEAMLRERSARGTLLQVVIASLVLQVVGLATPLFTKVVVDAIAPSGSQLSLGILAAAMTLVVFARTVTTFIRSAVMIRLQMRLDARLTEGFFDHLIRLPFAFFQGRSSGDLLMRLSSNTMIREVLTTQLLSLMLDGPLTLVYVAVLTLVAPSFALLVIALAVLQAVLVLASLRPLHDVGQRMLASKSDEQSCLVELMKGIAYVKASGAEQRAYDRWAHLFRRQLGIFVERAYLSAKLEVALGFIRTASPLALLWYGASLVTSGALPLGTMLALTALAASFLTPLMALIQSSQQLQLLEAYVERLADVLQTAPEPRAIAPARRLASGSGCSSPTIEARELTYRFAPGGPTVVDGVSFSVRPGEKLGIVGPTGSGKSTVLMLLLGLYRPSDGEIFYDGVPLSELDPREVRRQCGVVLQDVSLFSGSIHSNIALSAPAASRDDVIRAAMFAGIHDDIAGFPMGYETRIAESGSNLSGGQRQCVAIARALVTRPAVLLLDEASSHLDVAAEQRLNANLEALRCTRIVVAHRLTAVRSANQILVMRAGCVVERGTHVDLMKLGGEYAALAAGQGPAIE